MTPRRALIVVPIVVALAAALPVVSAQAGIASIDVSSTPSLDREVASFDLEFEINGPASCIDGPTGEAFGEGTEDVVAATVTLGEGDGTVAFADSVPGGYYDVTISCDVGEGTIIRGSTSVAFARGYVAKAVEGDVPADAEFVIDVSCEGEGEETDVTAAAPFSLTFTYPSTGGQEGMVVYSGQDCTVTETEDGGAVETTVEGTLSFPEPADETVTVTNVFAAAVTPPTPPAPPAVQPVVATPGYTG